jgi:hypothetical protein
VMIDKHNPVYDRKALVYIEPAALSRLMCCGGALRRGVT